MDSVDTLCKRIDRVLVEYFDTLTQLYNEQTTLDGAVKSGFLNLSRARYNMGIQSVGIEQCDDNNMTASHKVIVTEDGQLKLMKPDAVALERKFADLDLDLKNSDEKSTVRKRNIGNNEKIGRIEDVELKEIKSKSTDPLKWFGILVPPSLRQSQCDFKTSVQSAVSIACLKVKLVSLQKEYRQLLDKKAKLSS